MDKKLPKNSKTSINFGLKFIFARSKTSQQAAANAPGGDFFFFHPGSILDWSIFFSRKTINNFWCIFVENKYASFILGWSIFLLEKKIIINNCRCILGGERIFANFILDWSSYNLSKSNYLDQKNETKVNSKQLPMHLGGEQIC